jgi:hypothetical protein
MEESYIVYIFLSTSRSPYCLFTLGFLPTAYIHVASIPARNLYIFKMLLTLYTKVIIQPLERVGTV